MIKVKGPKTVEGRILNLLPSPVDERDYAPQIMTASLQTEVPEQFSTVNKNHLVRNQGTTGSCVGYGITDAILAALGSFDSRWFNEPLSASFIWMGAKEIDSISLPSTLAGADGTYIRAGLMVALKYGNLYERFAPLGAISSYESAAMYNDAKWIRIASFHKLKQSDYVRTLLSGSQIVIGVDTWSSFFDPTNRVLSIEDTNGSSMGRHCCRIVGYENYGQNTVFHIGNSWGNSWGVDGYARVDSSWLKQAVFEAYSMTIPAINYLG